MTTMIRAAAAFASCVLVSHVPAFGAAETASRAPAELVVRDGRLYTLDPARPQASALAIRGGRIVAVGSDQEISGHVGPGTEVLDLEGRPAYPGFIDSHAHLLSLGQLRLSIDLTDARDFEEVLARVRRAARERPAGSWLIGRGWHEARWTRAPRDAVRGFPVHARLSAITPDHPVVLERADGHAVLVNARALQAMSITRATRPPAGGEIVRDATGEPTGVLVDRAAELIRPPASSREEKARALALAFEECLRFGVTLVHDAGVDADTLELFRELAATGRLPIRVYAMLGGGEVLRAVQRPEIGLGDGFLTIRAVKLYADGALGSRGAALLEPYADDPGNSGLLLSAPEELGSIVRLALERGFQVATHAIGDRGNRLVLDLYERELARLPRADRRLRIEHAQVLDAADIPRFSGLGIIASMQAIHATSDRPWAPDRIGMARVKEGAYAWRKLLASGAHIANGTDAPVEPLDPVRNFHAAVTRTDARGQPAGGFDPEERMTREEALRSLTVEGARAAFQERELGALTAGRRADLVVLSADIMRIPEAELLSARVVHTIVAGKVAFRAP